MTGAPHGVTRPGARRYAGAWSLVSIRLCSLPSGRNTFELSFCTIDATTAPFELYLEVKALS
jgi:hypothetical protein